MKSFLNEKKIRNTEIIMHRMLEFTSILPESSKGQYEMHQFENLKVQSLSFRFPGRKQIIKDISFDVNRGEVIAIMGENGCGKSTLVQILQKYYQPEAGQIILNNKILLNQIATHNWRRLIGVVPQHIHIFNGTVLENIAFDDVKNKAEEVVAFLLRMGFAPFIDSLPQSIMTLVGEEGINLSGGQKQIIALARTLYYQPQLLILDEATAAMDRQSEQFVLQILQQLKKEMGIIFITHRLHVLKSFCDRIYILENGKITNFGGHEQLLQSKNLYSNYWKDLVS